MPTELLSIQRGELKFPFESKKQISSSLRLVNSTDNYVAFKVKTRGIGGSIALGLKEGLSRLGARPFALQAWRVATPNRRTYISCSFLEKRSELTSAGVPDSQAEKIVALVEAEGVAVQEKCMQSMELRMKTLEDKISSRIDLMETKLSSQIMQTEIKILSVLERYRNDLDVSEIKILSVLERYRNDLDVSDIKLNNSLESRTAFFFLLIVFSGMGGFQGIGEIAKRLLKLP